MTGVLGRFGASAFPRRRPRAVWAAFITSLAVSVLVIAGVLLPVLGLIGGAAAASVGVLRVPTGQIFAAVVIGCLLAIVLLVACLATRFGWLAWILGVGAVVSVLLVSVWPLVATALAAVHEVSEIVPFIQHLVARTLPR